MLLRVNLRSAVAKVKRLNELIFGEQRPRRGVQRREKFPQSSERDFLLSSRHHDDLFVSPVLAK